MIQRPSPPRETINAQPREEPTEIDVRSKEDNQEQQELQQNYQQRGQLIRANCESYCGEVLDKIDDLYLGDNKEPRPFICVEGSSGMGKSQLAFTLEGHRPLFYWLVVDIWSSSQCLYRNFRSISSAFRKIVDAAIHCFL